jgi:virginiamycin B lyase
MRNRAFLALLSMAVVAPVGPAAAQTVDIKEWPVEWEGRPRDPYVDGQNRVWFVGQAGNYIAHFEPSTEQFKRYVIPEGTHPHNLIVDTDGAVWFAGNRAAYIGRLDPKSGDVKRYEMPDPAARDPHTLVFDRQGNIWFTVQGGGFIGRLNKASGKVDLVKATEDRARPYGIWMDTSDRPWINLFGTNKIATVDPKTMTLREIALPRAEARTRRIAVTPDDMVWYVDHEVGYLGRMDPKTGEVEEWASPGGTESRPYAMTIDDQARIWYVETGVSPNQLVGFDPNTEKFFSVTPVPSGGGAVRHMVFHAPTNTIWFGTDTNNIARATIH